MSVRLHILGRKEAREAHMRDAIAEVDAAVGETPEPRGADGVTADEQPAALVADEAKRARQQAAGTLPKPVPRGAQR